MATWCDAAHGAAVRCVACRVCGPEDPAFDSWGLGLGAVDPTGTQGLCVALN